MPHPFGHTAMEIYRSVRESSMASNKTTLSNGDELHGKSYSHGLTYDVREKKETRHDYTLQVSLSM